MILRRFALIPALLFLCFLCVSGAWAADESDFSYDLRSMLQMNPGFSTYAEAGAPDGVIWLKRVHYGIADAGGIERRTMWIILGREGLPERWLSWNVPVPEDGEAEFLEASVYSRAEAVKTGSALPSDSSGDTLRSVTFSGLPDEYILVVHYREVFPNKLTMDGLEWISEALPVWEAVINVTVPAGHPFCHFSSQSIEPYEEQDAGRTVYEWHAVDTAAEVHPSIKDTGREYVAFGSRDSDSPFAWERLIRDAEDVPLPDAPQAVQDMLSGKNSAAAIENVLTWLYKQPGITLTGEPRAVPAEAPWTAGEKTLLAAKWLTGKTSSGGGPAPRLFWRLAYDPDKEGLPVSEAALVAPVLEISAPKAASSYYDMERMPGGRDGARLTAAVYGLQVAGDGLEERRPAVQKAGDNSLNVRFDLSLGDDGIMAGTVQISARRAWRQFLFPERPVSDDLAAVMRNMFTQAPRYSDLTFKETGTEAVLSASLSGVQAIKGTGGGHILASQPPFIPRWFNSLAGPFPYTLSFPFVINVRIVTTLPPSTENAILPAPSLVPPEMSAGKVRYTDSYKLDRRKRFISEARITVDTTHIADDDAAALGVALQNWQTFITAYLPVQLKIK